MTNKNQPQIDQLLKQVLTMETQAAFDFLKSADASQAVINQVALLLSPSDTRTAFLQESGLIGELFNEQKNQDLSGVTIGNIQFIKPLGQGGMGAVYLAEDTTLQRKVAVKALHKSLQINPAVQERFRREALILSKLDHPNICRIYHLIETKQADYLVLELIEGQTLSQTSIKQFSKSKKFAIALSLLKALKTAHSKDIIHRDLKPENIMLDDQGEVKILDFGISRLSSSPNTVKNIKDQPLQLEQQTVQGSVMGTLAYMSPEQAAGTEITTASDIYTLGLVFQELFSQTPVYSTDLTVEQILKFSTAAQTQTPTDLPHDLTQLIQRMKAKSPAARPTAVDAESIMERIMNKPARRVKYALVLAIMLVIGLGVYKHIKDLNYEREQAELAQKQAEQVTQFLTSIFRVSNPYLQKAEDLTALDLLQQGAERIDTELAEQPELKVLLKATIGDVYHLMGLLDQSKKVLSSAYEDIQTHIGINEATKGAVASMYGTLTMDLGDYELAEQLFNEAITNLAPTSPASVLANKNNLALIYSRLNQFEKTIAITDEVIAAFESKPDYDLNILVNTLNTAGMARHVSGDLPGAEQKYQAAMDLIKNQTAAEIEFTTEVNLMGNLAGVYGLTERLDESLKIRQQVVAMSEQRLPENHPDLIGTYDNLAVDYYYLEDLGQAKYWNKKSLDVFEFLTTNNQNQDDNFIYSYSMTLANYGVLLTRSNDYEQAKEVFTDVVAKLSQILGKQHTTVADYLYELANVHFQLGDNDLTLDFAQRAIDIYETDEVPFGSRELKSWLLKASVMNQSEQYVAVDVIETMLTSKLDSMDPKNQKLIDLAVEKFTLLKAARVMQ